MFIIIYCYCCCHYYYYYYFFLVVPCRLIIQGNIHLFLQNAQQIYGPFLVVVPLSTLSNWAKEFKKWLPDLNVIVYVGTRASREVSHTLYWVGWCWYAVRIYSCLLSLACTERIAPWPKKKRHFLDQANCVSLFPNYGDYVIFYFIFW